MEKMGVKRCRKVKEERGRRRGCSRHVRRGSESLDLIRGGGRGDLLKIRPAICREEGRGVLERREQGEC